MLSTRSLRRRVSLGLPLLRTLGSGPFTASSIQSLSPAPVQRFQKSSSISAVRNIHLWTQEDRKKLSNGVPTTMRRWKSSSPPSSSAPSPPPNPTIAKKSSPADPDLPDPRIFEEIFRSFRDFEAKPATEKQKPDSEDEEVHLRRHLKMEREIEEIWKPLKDDSRFWDFLQTHYSRLALTEKQRKYALQWGEDPAELEELKTIYALDSRFSLPFGGDPIMEGPLLIRRSMQDLFTEVLNRPNCTFFLEGCPGIGKSVDLGVLFLLMVMRGGRDVFCYVRQAAFFAYLHETGEVHYMDRRTHKSAFWLAHGSEEKEDAFVAQLEDRFPSISHKSSVVLYDPHQTQGNIQVVPIGKGIWESQMVVANSPRALDFEWKALMLEKFNFETRLVFDPSWEEFREMAMALELTGPETRAAYLCRGPVLRHLRRFRLIPEDEELLGLDQTPLPWPKTREDYIVLSQRIPGQALDELRKLLKLRRYMDRMQSDEWVSAKVFGQAPNSLLSEALPFQGAMEGFLTAVTPTVRQNIRQYDRRVGSFSRYIRSSALLMMHHLHENDFSVALNWKYDQLVFKRLAAAGESSPVPSPSDPSKAKEKDDTPKIGIKPPKLLRGQLWPSVKISRGGNHVDLISGFVVAGYLCRPPKNPKGLVGSRLRPTPSRWERRGLGPLAGKFDDFRREQWIVANSIGLSLLSALVFLPPVPLDYVPTLLGLGGLWMWWFRAADRSTLGFVSGSLIKNRREWFDRLKWLAWTWKFLLDQLIWLPIATLVWTLGFGSVILLWLSRQAAALFQKVFGTSSQKSEEEEVRVLAQWIENLWNAARVYFPVQLVTFLLPFPLQMPWMIAAGSCLMRYYGLPENPVEIVPRLQKFLDKKRMEMLPRLEGFFGTKTQEPEPQN